MNPIQLRSEQVESITELRELPGGGRELEIRGQFWGTWSCAGAVALRPDSDPEMREAPDGERQLPGEGQASFIIGTASSTGVDMHGTEMSREALDSMARQMGGERGVSYAPTHPEREWHEIIGRTVRADVIPVDNVANAADEGEAAYLLRVAAQIDPEHPRGRDLIRALRNGVQVGQSIGGWFTRVRVEENDRGEIERIIVLDVVLDHLAATRTPSNQDSDDLAELRSKLSSAMRSMHDGEEGPTHPATDPEERHILDVEDAGDVVRVTYAKADSDLSHHDEDDDERRDPEIRDVVPFQDLPLSERDESWSWSTEAQNEVLGIADDPDADPNWDRYRRAHLWWDPEADETKSGYKLPVARMFNGELRVVFRGLAAAVAALNGARGGVDISEDDRERAYRHAVRYYKKFDEEPPALRSIDSIPEDIDPSASEEVREDDPATSKSEATAEETHDEESEMDMDELKSMLEGVVGKANEGVTAEIRSITERLEALESRGTPAAEEQEEPEIDIDAIVAERVAEREAELKAKLDAATERHERDGKIVDRLLQRSVRETRSYQEGELHALLSSRDGDFEDLIERSEKTGETPALVAVSKRSRRLSKVRDAGENDPVSIRDMRSALSELCRAAELDGVIQPPKAGSFR